MNFIKNLKQKKMIIAILSIGIVSIGIISIGIISIGIISIIFIYLYNGGYSRIPSSSGHIEEAERLKVLYDKQYKIKDRLKYYLADNEENVGLIYKDLTTGEIITINPDKNFLAASTYKVGLNIYAYNLVKNNQIYLDDMVPYKISHFEEGAGILQFKDDLESEELQTLLDLSISNSDNIASNMISDYLGGKENIRKELNKLFKLDMPIDENIISPNDELEMLQYIYDNSNNPYMAHLIDVMKNTVYNNRINMYLPEGITAHKVGTYDTSIHDVGIVYDKNPYIIIVYTENLVEDVTVDSTYAENLVANISKAIYEYHISK